MIAVSMNRNKWEMIKFDTGSEKVNMEKKQDRKNN